jgi:hypothetical protein
MKLFRSTIATGISLLLGAFGATLAAPAISAPAAPHVQITALKQLPTPLPSPYDACADANAQVAAAYAREIGGKAAACRFRRQLVPGL